MENYRRKFLVAFNQDRTYQEAESLVHKMTVAQVVELSDSFLKRNSDTGLPLKRLRTKNRVFCAISEVYWRLNNYMSVEVGGAVVNGSCEDERLAAKKLLLRRLNTALDLLKNTAEFSVKFGKGKFDPYWLIDDAADLINEAIVKVGGGNRK